MSDKTELKPDSMSGMGGGTAHEKGPIHQDITQSSPSWTLFIQASVPTFPPSLSCQYPQRWLASRLQPVYMRAAFGIARDILLLEAFRYFLPGCSRLPSPSSVTDWFVFPKL